MPYTMKFMVMVCAAFLARVNPVSTMAKPACMNITRNPATSVQTKLIATVLAVALERLGQQPNMERFVEEHVGKTHLLAHPLDPRLHETELPGVGQAQRVEALRLGLAYVAGSRLGVGIGVFVVIAQRLPVLVPGALHRGSDVVARERHAIATGRAPPGCPALAP